MPATKHPTRPCATCPYRRDVKVKHWHRSEFEKLLKAEKTMLGTVYGCHKIPEPGKRVMCAGWLLDQKKRNVPSLRLRMLLSTNDAALAAFEKVKRGSLSLYRSTETMCRANGVRPETVESAS